MTLPLFLFYLFALIALAGALGMVLNARNTVAGALSLVGTMIALGAIYVLLDAYLIGVLQILIYAGAIVVLFLFVVMLLNLRHDAFAPAKLRIGKGLGVVLALVAVVVLFRMIPSDMLPSAVLEPGWGGYRHVGLALFRDWVLAFEATSLLLLAAMVGSVILAKRKIG